ncbi:MAG TPA: DNA-binding protein [Ruminococcus flavefaciens]|nr:DNA-binding protein [Ruminococcus flavefaciens]
MIEGYTTIKNIAAKWGITPRRVQVMCSQEKIPGAVKFGRDWAIPINADKPEDGRITTGEYRNWQKKEKIILWQIHKLRFWECPELEKPVIY